MALSRSRRLLVPVLLFLVTNFAVNAIKVSFLTISDEDVAADGAESSSSVGKGSGFAEKSLDREFFVDPDTRSDEEIDPGAWYNLKPTIEKTEHLYRSGITNFLSSSAIEDVAGMDKAAEDIESAATEGHPHAQSAMAFLHGAGILRPRSKTKAFLYHNFAAAGGNAQSKMALAYHYYRQENYEKALELYAELAEAAVSTFLVSKDHPPFELPRIYEGKEENKVLLRGLRGEEDESFQVIEHQATRGDPKAMYQMGMFYYFGLRGLKPDVYKAMLWFMRAAAKREARSMEMLGEMYARDVGFGKNYSQAFDWFSLAAQEQHLSAYNGLGYLYVRGYGVKERNYTKARLYFEKTAKNRVAGGHYNLGVLHLNGLGVKRSVTKAIKYLIPAANAGHTKALFQVAHLVKKGIGLPQDLGIANPKNLMQATTYYKKIAEKGPWMSMFGLAIESYNRGDIGKALLLYLRMAELGYEVAQSNAAWILDKYGENSMCVGEFGSCTDRERHFHVHSLWWQASEQGNEHAALLIGDAYYYGKGTGKDYELAAEAYMLARSAQPKPNAQAMFNLGYMYEHGKGLPLDLHLAKRYYDQALESDPSAKVPVTFALASLWIRKNYADSVMVDFIDSLPEVFPRVQAWVTEIITGEGNATIIALLVCLVTIIYLRERQRRRVVVAFPPVGHPPEERLN